MPGYDGSIKFDTKIDDGSLKTALAGLKNSLASAGKTFDTLGDAGKAAFAQLSTDFSKIDAKADILGDSLQGLAEKKKYLTQQITHLIDQGLKPEDAQLKALQSVYKSVENAEAAYGNQSKKTQSSFAQLRDVMQGPIALAKELYRAFSQLASAAYGMYTDFADAQLQTVRLGIAIKNNSEMTSGAEERLSRYADQLQMTTIYEADYVRGIMANLVAQGKTESQINRLIKISADYASATGSDLNSAVERLSGTLQGSARGLDRENKAIEALSETQLKNGEALDILEKQYAGFAETVGTTASGNIERLKNAIGELKEGIGEFIDSQIASKLVQAIDAINLVMEGINITKLYEKFGSGATLTIDEISRLQKYIEDASKINETAKSSFNEMGGFSKWIIRILGFDPSKELTKAKSDLDKLSKMYWKLWKPSGPGSSANPTGEKPVNKEESIVLGLDYTQRIAEANAKDAEVRIESYKTEIDLLSKTVDYTQRIAEINAKDAESRMETYLATDNLAQANENMANRWEALGKAYIANMSEFDKLVIGFGETWDKTSDSIGKAILSTIGDSVVSLGESLVTQKDAWGEIGVSALRAGAVILKSLGDQLLAQTALVALQGVTALLSGNLVAAGAALTAVLVYGGAAVVAYAGSGVLGALADSTEKANEETTKLDDSIRSFKDSLANIGADISSMLIDSLVDGLDGEDFLYALEEYITESVVKAAVFTDAFKAEAGAIGKAIADGIAGGTLTEGQLSDLKDRLGSLYATASSAAEIATGLVQGAFSSYAVGSMNIDRNQLANIHRGEMILPSGIAQEARSMGLFIGPSGGMDTGTMGRSQSINISVNSMGSVNLDGREIGRIAFEYQDQIAGAAYGS
jgi:hypothetical protein